MTNVMPNLLSPWTLAVAAALVATALLASPNAQLWFVSAMTVPAAVWLAGGTRVYPVLAWLIGLNWLSIVGDVLAADLAGQEIAGDWMGQYRGQAIYFSLCAVMSISLGMRCGVRLGGRVFGRRAGAGAPVEFEYGVDTRRAVAAYFISLILAQTIAAFANALPGLTQPLLALALLRFVCIYLVASRVFASERGYYWLLLVLLFEFGIGGTGYFASYKEAFFVTLIAMMAGRGTMSFRKVIFAGMAVIVVIWFSLVWTVVKTEFRSQVFDNSIQQRVEWMVGRVLANDIDYAVATIKLAQRVGYTDNYAQLLARLDLGSIPGDLDLLGAAIRHVLTPRVLFPDKAILDDSKLTTALLGFKIDENTSIGVGYVAEAHVDFGFPAMLLPLSLLGAMIGGTAKFFMTRPKPLLIREAFMTASVFSSFAFEANIDKVLGGFITGCLAMALVLKFGYPIIAQWLAGGCGNPRFREYHAPERMPA
jgi:hypothetical protein